jgi:hypothetical protein
MRLGLTYLLLAKQAFLILAQCSALSLLCQACLIPMPIEQEPVEPNYQPYYLFEQTMPVPGELVLYEPAQQENISFLVAGLNDLNEDDLLYWRVFLNYEGKYYNAIFRSNIDNGLDREAWSKGISFELDPCFDFKIFNLKGPFRIELVVSDRPFLDLNEGTIDQNGEEAFILFPNQMIPEQAKSFRIHWMVDYDKNNCIL